MACCTKASSCQGGNVIVSSLGIAPEFLPMIRSGAKCATTRLMRSESVHKLGFGGDLRGHLRPP